MENNEAFLGRGWAFPPEFFSNGAELETVSGEEDIRESLTILLSTATGERTMNPAYGCDLSRFLFEEIDQGLINGLSNVISDSLLNHEPRIQVDDIQFDSHASEQGLILISIDYTVRTTNNRYNMVYPFYINEATQPQT